MTTFDQLFEREECLSDLSVTSENFQKRMTRIYSSNLEQTYKLINECSQKNKEYQSKLLELSSQNTRILKENQELKSKLSALTSPAHSSSSCSSSTKNLELSQEQSRVSTLWPSESLFESEACSEKPSHGEAIESPLKPCRSTKVNPWKKRAVLKTALIHSVSFLNF